MTCGNREHPNPETLADTAQHRGRSVLVTFALEDALVFHRNEPKIFYQTSFTMTSQSSLTGHKSVTGVSAVQMQLGLLSNKRRRLRLRGLFLLFSADMNMKSLNRFMLPKIGLLKSYICRSKNLDDGFLGGGTLLPLFQLTATLYSVAAADVSASLFQKGPPRGSAEG